MILLATGTQRAAKTSRVAVSQQSLAFSSWLANASVVDLPTHNFTSFDLSAYSSDGLTAGQTYDEGISGILSSSFDFGGDWDAAANPLDVNSPPGLYPRDDMTDTYLYINVADDSFWYYPYSRIRTAQNGGQVGGLVTFTTSGNKNQGPFTMPVGSV